VLLLSTGSLYTQPLARVFEWGKAAGFDGIELLVDRRPETRDLDHVKSLASQAGLPVPVVHAPFHSQPTPEWGPDSVDRVLGAARLGKALGAGLVVVHLPLWRERVFARWLVEELADVEDELGLALAVENLPAKRQLIPGVGLRGWPFRFREPDDTTLWGRVLTKITRPGMRFNTVEELAGFEHVVFDVTHWARRGDIFRSWEGLRHAVAHIHLSNYSDRGGHRAFWDGSLDIQKFLRRVLADGYAGHFTAELCPQALGDPDEPTVVDRLARTVGWFASAARP